MKKLFPVIVMLLLPALNGLDVKAGSGTETLSTQEKLEKRLASAERWQKWSPMATNNALQDIVDLMKKPELDAGARREATKRMIKIYYAVDDSSLTNNANKKRILEAIGRSDNSEEAQKFFLDVLSSDNKEYRRMALWSISPYGTHGDAIYNKIKSLESAGILSRGDSLVQLANANPERAIEEIKKFLRTTQDLKEFVGVALNLPKKYHSDPDTLDVIVDRYEDFKSKPISAEFKGYTPEGALMYPWLWKYIDAREGKRLRIALEIIKNKGVCGSDDIPHIVNKIKSTNAITREATVDFLDSQIDSGNLSKEKVLPILEEARNGEHDQKLKKKLGEIIGRRKKGGRP